ncbi:MAG: DUF4290 domain-containing protein [Bacteroidetes bacterium]|nr:DUF4290 domain-containing protein [Bacteroidota bacterium]
MSTKIPRPKIMEYNSSRNQMVIPEYGRNIQKMIEYAMTIEDREERNRAAKAIVTVMGFLNPQIRDIVDFKHKLWDHLFLISDFKLDVDSPYPIPPRETLKVKPQRIKYPESNIRYKYYGKAMEQMIRKIGELEEGERKNQIAQNLANFMKMSYLTWNKDSVDDSTILGHLEELSDGQVKLHEEVRLNHTAQILAMNAQKKQLQQQQHVKNNNAKRQQRRKKK